MSAAEKVESGALLPLETQQLVAGVFATKAGYDAAAGKMKAIGPQLQMVNASNLLVLAKDEEGNDPEEAVYLFTTVDDRGEPLPGEHTYELIFPAGLTP